MKDTQSFLMFVTGVVGRSMQSGQFAHVTEIATVTEAAVAAWKAYVEPEIPEGHKPAPARSQTPSAPPYKPSSGGGGFKRPFDLAANWGKWKEDEIKFGKKESPISGKSWGQCTWDEMAMLVAKDNGQAVTYLKYMIDKANVNDPQWGQANRKRKEKAEYVLREFGQQGETDVAEAGMGSEDTPF